METFLCVPLVEFLQHFNCRTTSFIRFQSNVVLRILHILGELIESGTVLHESVMCAFFENIVNGSFSCCETLDEYK